MMFGWWSSTYYSYIAAIADIVWLVVNNSNKAWYVRIAGQRDIHGDSYQQRDMSCGDI